MLELDVTHLTVDAHHKDQLNEESSEKYCHLDHHPALDNLEFVKVIRALVSVFDRAQHAPEEIYADDYTRGEGENVERYFVFKTVQIPARETDQVNIVGCEVKYVLYQKSIHSHLPISVFKVRQYYQCDYEKAE